jgi:hypothetical protein
VFYKKPFHDNIYKQLEFGGVIVIRLVICYGELVKGGGKRSGWVD